MNENALFNMFLKYQFIAMGHQCWVDSVYEMTNQEINERLCFMQCRFRELSARQHFEYVVNAIGSLGVPVPLRALGR